MEHFRQEKNEYFTHAVMLVTSDDSLGPTEISYLENAFHSRALAAGRVRTLNSNDPSPGTVTEEKKADLEEFIALQLSLSAHWGTGSLKRPMMTRHL